MKVTMLAFLKRGNKVSMKSTVKKKSVPTSQVKRKFAKNHVYSFSLYVSPKSKFHTVVLKTDFCSNNLQIFLYWRIGYWNSPKKFLALQKLFFIYLGLNWRDKIFKFKFLKKTLDFHQLITSIGTCFVKSLKALGASELDFLPKKSKTSNGRGRPNF